MLFGATPLGRELAPRVAVTLQTGLTADCTVLAIDPQTGLLQQTSPAFGGNLMATIVCPAHPLCRRGGSWWWGAVSGRRKTFP